MRLAHVIPADRCQSCGQRLPAWTPRAMIRAAQKEHAETGYSPRMWRWRQGTPEHPAEKTVRQTFGTWEAFLRAAGLPLKFDRRRGEQWMEQEVIDAMLDWLLKHGRWPKLKDWNRAEDGHPHYMTVLRMYGNWTNAKIAAGWEPRLKAAA